MIGIEMKLNIPIHYQMGNPLQQGRWPCDLYIQSYLPSLSVTYDRSLVFFGYSGFFHQQNWPPRYSRNIVESGVKHHKPIQNQTFD